MRDVDLDGDDDRRSAADEAVVGLSRELVGAGWGSPRSCPSSATLESLFFELTEGGRARATAEPREADRPHRLPLGAAQARLPEAHVHRHRRRGARCR